MAGPVDWDKLVLGPCQSVFGESVQWFHGTSTTPSLVSGIFDNGWKPMDIEISDGLTPTHVVSSDACIGVQLSQFVTAPAKGDHVIIRNQRWIVREVTIISVFEALLGISSTHAPVRARMTRDMVFVGATNPATGMTEAKALAILGAK